jgi:hypothetical protein
MKVIKAPHDFLFAKRSVFLAGSIEMGKAVDWQTRVTESLSDLDILVMNPRRDDWDSSWIQDISNPQFYEQVEWELDALEYASVIAMYFDPKTMSPISLLELGLHAKNGNMIVCCPEGFWRKGNVDMVCEKYGVLRVNTIEDLIKNIRERLNVQRNHY